MDTEEPDRIDIEDLTVRTLIGIFDAERTRKQEVILRLTLYTDIREASRTDAIEHAIDYKQVTKRVIAMVESSSCYLLETLTERVARLVLEEFEVPRVTVRIEKPGALRFARTVAVTITRNRGDS